MNLNLLANHPLRHAVEEFSAANVAYRNMDAIGVGDFVEYEKAWRTFLHRIERVWTKTQAAVHRMPGWKKIESEISHLRKSDPLLNYLQQARNVEEHSIQELATDWDAKLTAVQLGTEVQLSWQPWDRPLLPVTNRSVRFDPPRIHLGKSIEPQLGKGKAEPRVVAELALRFYVDFLNRVSTEVVGDKRDV
jgi:hypothetical protein